MNSILLRFCFALWFLGFTGMWSTKGVRALGDLPFAISTRLALVGGLSLCFLVILDAYARVRRAE
ncbi:MAG: hypothetical protein AAF682_10120 [Planctomycetota bacterium]